MCTESLLNLEMIYVSKQSKFTGYKQRAPEA